MDSAQIENKLKDLTSQINHESFLFDLLTIYNFPKATLARLKKGDANLSKNIDEYLLKNKVLYKAVHQDDPHYVIDELTFNENILKYRPRFIIVTNFKTFLAQDTKTKDSLDIQIELLSDHYDFFFPWIGREKSKIQNEAIADIKAADKMAQLYDLLIQTNPSFKDNENKIHALNLFFARLLFCYFAEDTELFSENIFSSTFEINSNEDGSNAHEILSHIFHSLDDKDKNNYPSYCKKFPYVGGDIFQEKVELPLISRKARTLIIEAGKLNWYEINPDIFGSMIQVIASPQERADMRSHYTSVPNILKVINPLFMDSLNDQFEKCDSEKDFEKLLKRIYSLKIFDPASGSGNFLVVTYKKLCELEFRIYKSLQDLNIRKWTIVSIGLKISQFYGMTIKDFDASIGRVSMFLAEHQMILQLSDIFGTINTTLPYKVKAIIKATNAIKEDWESFLNIKNNDEIYIIGNPPYAGFNKQSKSEKEDFLYYLNKTSKNDYCSLWIYKAADLILKYENIEVAYVTTNSITQGEQVDSIWSSVLKDNIKIIFGYESFLWKNNAKDNAGVSCVIIGLGRKNRDKFIFTENSKLKVNSIGPYLTENNIIVKKTNSSMYGLPKILLGDMAKDGSNLIFEDHEKKSLCSKYPIAIIFFKRFIGATDFLNNEIRWCLWINEDEYIEAKGIPEINERFIKVRESRLKSPKKDTQKYSDRPYRFVEIRYENKNKLFIPTTSSENRRYLPIGYFSEKDLITAPNHVVYNAPIYIFTILSSYLHMLWIKTVCGKLENRIRYSSQLGYNTFPLPELSDNNKLELEKMGLAILDTREKYLDSTISEIYHYKKMPKDLFEIHKAIDKYLESIYSSEIMESDTKKINLLLNFYEESVKENAKSS